MLYLGYKLKNITGLGIQKKSSNFTKVLKVFLVVHFFFFDIQSKKNFSNQI